MLTIEYDNATAYIKGDFTQTKPGYELHNILRERLGYHNTAAEWSDKFKTGMWDGVVSLYSKRTQSFPTGLVVRCGEIFDELDIDYIIKDIRPKPKKNFKVVNNQEKHNREIRDYQEHAVVKALEIKSEEELEGRGIIASSVGSGKTTIACEIFARTQCAPVIFVVPTKSLLKQAKREFEKFLELNNLPIEVGMVGDGVCDVKLDGITVITWQSCLSAFNEKFVPSKNKIVEEDFIGERVKKTNKQLQNEYNEAKTKLEQAEFLLGNQYKELDTKAKEKKIKTECKVLQQNFVKAKNALKRRIDNLNNKKVIKELIENAQLLMVDEAHIAAIVIEQVSKHAKNAYYKLGLSATPYREDNQEIRIEGAFGRILVYISASDLIEMGYLSDTYVYFIKLSESEEGEDYADDYSLNIVNHWEKNYRTKQFAEGFKEMGKPVLILVEQIEHGKLLESLIKDAVFVAGSDKGDDVDEESDEHEDYRFRMLDACQRNEIVLIATSWAYTGVDAPDLGVLILAGSNSSASTTMQQIGRVLRKTKIKTEAIVIDFFHPHATFRKHSNARLKVSKNERAFKILNISTGNKAKKVQ